MERNTLLENVFTLSNHFMNEANDVRINWNKVSLTALKIKCSDKPTTDFPFLRNPDDEARECTTQLIINSINYCFWYGRFDFRPNGCSSFKLHETVKKIYDEFHPSCISRNSEFSLEFMNLIMLQLTIGRFPLLEKRKKHLEELILVGKDIIDLVIGHTDNTCDFSYIFTKFVLSFPGYASDMFLKRASLFFLMLYRKLGWFENDLWQLPVPADYQVPKILYYLDCLEYSPYLKDKITFQKLIPKHSRVECEIRAATVLVCQKLVEETGWNISDIDWWLWTKRHEHQEPFHLTITTDY